MNKPRHITTLVATLGTVLALGAAQAQDVAKISVNGMVCAFCAQGIEKTISKMPETKVVYVNLNKRVVAVEAKAGSTLNLNKIKAGIADAGYDVTGTQMLKGTSVAAIKTELTGKK